MIEENRVRILIDPGKYSILQNEVKNLDVILISHGHEDHCDMNSIKIILQNNPEAKIFTNSEVGTILEKENIKFRLLENGRSVTVKNIVIEGCGEKHIIVYGGNPAMKNVGFIINSKLFFTGDNLTKLNKKIEVLAFPMAGPVFSLSQILDYIKEINPKICLPLHDAMLNEKAETYYRFSREILDPMGIKFAVLEIGKEVKF